MSLDVIRVQVTKSRVSQELANLIHNQQIHGRCQTWKEVCTLLEREFSIEVSFDRAWKEIDDVRYEWVESPQAFVHSFICRYAVLENRFHGEILPDRDRMKECEKNPPKGRCFDCLSPDCRRGIEGCPGKPPNKAGLTQGKKSPMINVRVNEKLRHGAINTGSSNTLIREKAINDMKLEINQNRCVLVLQGVIGSTLRILGMVKP